MKIPKRLQPLIEDGLIDSVISRLMSGKEADVFIVQCGQELRCAKVYKESMNRSFKQAVKYREGRTDRNSRRTRAMEKGSKYGRNQTEVVWQTAEVDALNKLADAGLRVPKPYGCIDGVLLMELICDADGDVAPRLSEVVLSEDQALAQHAFLMRAVVMMLCAGIVHGDLSEFNVLVDAEGPVIIDLPQAVNAAANNHAEAMLARDVNNLTNFYQAFAPSLKGAHYAEEIWALFEAGNLHPDVHLTGQFEADTEAADVEAVVREITAAKLEEAARLERIAQGSSDD